MKPARAPIRAGEARASHLGTAESRRFGLSMPPAFRYPAYRNFWFGMLAAVGGFQMLMFGQFWLIHELTASPLFLGYVGLANALPAIALNLVGGVVADRFEKRRLIVVTQTASAALVFLLAALTLTGAVEAWHVLTIAVFAGAINAFNQPARMALYPYLVDREVLMSAVALNSSIWQGTRIVAPAVAGGLIAVFGTATAFFLAGAGILAMAIVVSSLKIPSTVQAPGPGRAGALTDMVEGLKFIRGNSIFSFLIAMTFFNSFFGMAYITLMPVFSVDILKVGADGQGVLLSVGGVGSLAVTVWLGTRANFRHRGFVLIGGAVMTGLSLAAFSLTAKYVGSFNLALALMFVLGTFTSMYMVSIMTSLQMMVPNRMRGRVMGFYGMTWNIMPLGGMYAGALAGLIGAPWAVAIGGLLVTGFAIGPALLNRQIRNLSQVMDRAEAAEAAAAG